ncbi:DNA methylase [Ruminococcus flavefaciens]|uniref:Y-family DNA polymerase n=1 Tax=Ruminococcus flavefaciens TaxID=1265 RepID=UPI0013DBA2E2|nr:DNA methylase [Ruminococcus flavefaciens]
MNKVYIAIDLKSFYASVECVDRHLDALTTNLVVADESRTEKTICLAVTPSLKAYGISGRARLFEVVQAVKEINQKRFNEAFRRKLLPRDENGKYHFSSASFDAEALATDPSLELSYIIAPPRMRLYEEISTKIFSIYMRYISPEDIHVYSIDECFIDATGYLNTYHMTAHELAMTMIREVLYETGITATAGIGTNLYLAKVAMDIVAKHVPADKDGVRIAELDEMKYRELLWCHTPLTDFWGFGIGTAARVAVLNCYTMGDIARLSTQNEGALYKALGVKAEIVIDHAWGWEPTEIASIKAYRPSSNSLSSGQVLKEPYTAELARLIVREMTELLVLDLVRKHVVTKKVTLTIGYDRTSVQLVRRGRTPKEDEYKVTTTGKRYNGVVHKDHYGRPVPKHAHGTGNLENWTSSTAAIAECMMQLYDRIIDPDLMVRRINICACNLIYENNIPEDDAPVQLELFVDYEEVERQKAEKKRKEERERALQRATLQLQGRFGKNAVLRGMNLMEGGTTIERNGQIGGHRAEASEVRKDGKRDKKQ